MTTGAATARHEGLACSPEKGRGRGRGCRSARAPDLRAATTRGAHRSLARPMTDQDRDRVEIGEGGEGLTGVRIQTNVGGESGSERPWLWRGLLPLGPYLAFLGWGWWMVWFPPQTGDVLINVVPILAAEPWSLLADALVGFDPDQSFRLSVTGLVVGYAMNTAVLVLLGLAIERWRLARRGRRVVAQECGW